jgi:hypothetical protein
VDTPPPPSLKPPTDEKLVLTAVAKGFQVYTCSPTGEGAFGWVLKEPDAVLFDAQGAVLGKHYAGPTWESTDGSSVVAKLTEKADAPDPNAVPWLLLRAKSNTGQGVFANVKSVQRVDTWGGKPAKDGCDAGHGGAERRVAYQARYHFYAKEDTRVVQRSRGWE